jgi:ABC-type antimicrobial peptide transport system permease subunit
VNAPNSAYRPVESRIANQSAISQLERAGDVRLSTLRNYLEHLGARLELLAVFGDDEHVVPIRLGDRIATLAVTAAQGWVPVIDPRIPVATIAGSVLAGVVAGAYPARVGSRLQPTEALRRE